MGGPPCAFCAIHKPNAVSGCSFGKEGPGAPGSSVQLLRSIPSQDARPCRPPTRSCEKAGGCTSRAGEMAGKAGLGQVVRKKRLAVAGFKIRSVLALRDASG